MVGVNFLPTILCRHYDYKNRMQMSGSQETSKLAPSI